MKFNGIYFKGLPDELILKIETIAETVCGNNNSLYSTIEELAGYLEELHKIFHSKEKGVLTYYYHMMETALTGECDVVGSFSPIGDSNLKQVTIDFADICNVLNDTFTALKGMNESGNLISTESNSKKICEDLKFPKCDNLHVLEYGEFLYSDETVDLFGKLTIASNKLKEIKESLDTAFPSMFTNTDYYIKDMVLETIKKMDEAIEAICFSITKIISACAEMLEEIVKNDSEFTQELLEFSSKFGKDGMPINYEFGHSYTNANYQNYEPQPSPVASTPVLLNPTPTPQPNPPVEPVQPDPVHVSEDRTNPLWKSDLLNTEKETKTNPETQPNPFLYPRQ